MRFIGPLLNTTRDGLLLKPAGINALVWKAVLITILMIIIIFTTAGNLLTLSAAIKMKQFHNSVSNLYIASLAGADLVVGSFVMTFMMLYAVVFDFKWVFGQWLCDAWQILDFVSCSVSLYSICAIAFDRWLNLQKPLRVFKRSRSIAQKSILIIWVSPVVIWITIFAVIGNLPKPDNPMDEPESSEQCYFRWVPFYLVPMLATPLFYIPILMLIFLFLRITFIIQNHLRFLHLHARMAENGTDYFKNSRRLPSSAVFETGKNFEIAKFTKELNSTARFPLATGPIFDKQRNSLEDPLSTPLLPNLNAEHGLIFAKQRKSVNPVSPSTKSNNTAENFDRKSQAVNLLEPTAVLIEDLRKYRYPSIPHLNKTLESNKRHFRKISCQGTGPIQRNLLATRKLSDSITVLSESSTERPKPIQRAQTETALLKTRTILPTRCAHRTSFLRSPSISRKFSSNLFSEVLPNSTVGIAQQMRAARAVGIIMFCFLLCWLPFMIIWPIKVYCHNCISEAVYQAATWANYLNSTLNPILYALCSPRFQNVIRRIICRCSFKESTMKTATQM